VATYFVLVVSHERHLWGVAVAPRDDSSVYDTLKIVSSWDAGRPLRTLIPDDV